MFLYDKECPFGAHIPGADCVSCERKESCPFELSAFLPPEDNTFFVTGNLRLPKRPGESHKGDYGRVLILGGCEGYTGAPTLCAKAALRAGAGLVSLGVPRSIYSITAVKNDEAMPFALPENFSETGFMERIAKADAVAVGPGMGRSKHTIELTELLLQTYTGPMLMDADALWAVSQLPGTLNNTQALIVMTPHDGEFSVLWPKRSGNKLRDARAYAAENGCGLVSKGHRTVVAFPDGKAYVIAAGNPGMAGGGSGDVLSGVIAAMLGQLPFEQAVVTGCWLHARAGDLAAGALGEYGMVASDIIDCLPRAEMEITEH